MEDDMYCNWSQEVRKTSFKSNSSACLSNAPRHDLRSLDIIVHGLVYPGEMVQQQIYVQICGKQVSLSHGIQGTLALVLKWPETNLRNWSKKKTTNEDEVQTKQEKQKEKPGSVFCNVSLPPPPPPLCSPWKQRLLLGTKNRVFFSPKQKPIFLSFFFFCEDLFEGMLQKKKKKKGTAQSISLRYFGCPVSQQ